MYADWMHTDLRIGIRRAAKTGWAGTKLLLDLLKESSDVFPPLKAAVGGLVALIDVYEVRGCLRKSDLDLPSTSSSGRGQIEPSCRTSCSESITCSVSLLVDYLAIAKRCWVSPTGLLPSVSYALPLYRRRVLNVTGWQTVSSQTHETRANEAKRSVVSCYAKCSD